MSRFPPGNVVLEDYFERMMTNSPISKALFIGGIGACPLNFHGVLFFLGLKQDFIGIIGFGYVLGLSKNTGAEEKEVSKLNLWDIWEICDSCDGQKDIFFVGMILFVLVCNGSNEHLLGGVNT